MDMYLSFFLYLILIFFFSINSFFTFITLSLLCFCSLPYSLPCSLPFLSNSALYLYSLPLFSTLFLDLMESQQATMNYFAVRTQDFIYEVYSYLIMLYQIFIICLGLFAEASNDIMPHYIILYCLMLYFILYLQM